MARRMPFEMNYLRGEDGQAQGTELRHWLSICKSSSSTNPRDKVFALLGLATDENIKQIIRVDYSKTVTEICREVLDFYLLARGQSKDQFYDNIGWISLHETLQKMLGQELESTAPQIENPELEYTLWCATENIGIIIGFPERHTSRNYTSNSGPSPRDMAVEVTMVQYGTDDYKYQLALDNNARSQTPFNDNSFFSGGGGKESVETRNENTFNTAPPSAKEGDCILGFPGSRIGLLLRDRKVILGRVLMHGEKYKRRVLYTSMAGPVPFQSGYRASI